MRLRGAFTRCARRQLRTSTQAQYVVVLHPTNNHLQVTSQRTACCHFSTGGPQSEDSEQSEDGEQETTTSDPRMKVLEASLAHVVTDGWTIEAIQRGAMDANVEQWEEFFPRGAVELVDHFMLRGNEELIKYMTQNEEWHSLGMTAKVRAAVKTRLMFIAPVSNTWAQAMAIGAQPQNLANTLKIVATMVDSIWNFAGDKSPPTDYNWYTKRTILAGVYGSTEVIMLTDNSEGFEDTWNFLDNRLQDVATFGKMTGKAKQQTQHAQDFGVAVASQMQDLSRSAAAGASGSAPGAPPGAPPGASQTAVQAAAAVLMGGVAALPPQIGAPLSAALENFGRLVPGVSVAGADLWAGAGAGAGAGACAGAGAGAGASGTESQTSTDHGSASSASSVPPGSPYAEEWSPGPVANNASESSDYSERIKAMTTDMPPLENEKEKEK